MLNYITISVKSGLVCFERIRVISFTNEDVSGTNTVANTPGIEERDYKPILASVLLVRQASTLKRMTASQIRVKQTICATVSASP